jgi:hypothetical protein
VASNLSGETEVIGQRVKLVPWKMRSSNRAQAKWTSYLRGSSPRARTTSRTKFDQVTASAMNRILFTLSSVPCALARDARTAESPSLGSGK